MSVNTGIPSQQPDVFEIIQALQNRIRRLEKIKPVIDGGFQNVNISAINTDTSVTITFNKVFENVPVIQLTTQSGSAANTRVTYSGASITQFTLTVNATVTGNRTVSWLAYDPT